MKKLCTALTVLLLFLCMTACGAESVDPLTYAVYPYLPDAEYYQQLIERRWAELEPDIQLVRAQWDCYLDRKPEGIDVIMYDAVMQDRILSAGWIQPIRPDAVHDAGDIFPFALEGLTVENRLYGIPVFLCGNFLIYDQAYEALGKAEHLTDLAEASGILVVNSEDPANRPQYMIEVAADTLGEANPSADDSPQDGMQLIDRLAIDAHMHDDNTQVVMAYDSGVGQGYIGFSESMRLLSHRSEQTMIRSISFSDRENILRLYTDAVAVTAAAHGQRYEKCLELMNVMAEADVLTALSVLDGQPQYLLLARQSPFRPLAGQYPLYARLEELAGNEKNHVILTP